MVKKINSQSGDRPSHHDVYPRSRHLLADRSFLFRKTEALAILDGTAIPKKFKFREREASEILEFVDLCIEGRKKGYRFLMVTGAPGVGKTLTVNSSLEKRNCRQLKLNANINTTMREIQGIICQELLGKNKINTANTFDVINAFQAARFKEPCVVYIEEIEVLFKDQINLFSSEFMNLFLNKKTNLSLIGISNSINALQLHRKRTSIDLSSVRNIVFKGYSALEIAEIMTDKLTEVFKKTKLQITFPENILKYSTNKLQNWKNSDFRCANQFLKELIEHLFEKEGSGVEASEYLVRIETIELIFRKMQAPKNEFIANMSFNMQIILLAIYNNMKRADSLAVTRSDLIDDMRWICASLALPYENQHIINHNILELEHCGIVTVTKKKKPQICVNLDLEQIYATFNQHPIFGKFFRETPDKINKI